VGIRVTVFAIGVGGAGIGLDQIVTRVGKDGTELDVPHPHGDSAVAPNDGGPNRMDSPAGQGLGGGRRGAAFLRDGLSKRHHANDTASVMEPNIVFQPDFWPEAPSLFVHLQDQVIWDTRLRARKTATFGVPYNYSGMTYEPSPVPEILLPLIAKLEESLGWRANNCLVNYYENGDSTMGFHRDSEEPLVPNTGIAIVSLGETRTLTFRHHKYRDNLHRFDLPSGSFVFMPWGLQASWLHGVMKQADAGPRMSLTFRKVRF